LHGEEGPVPIERGRGTAAAGQKKAGEGARQNDAKLFHEKAPLVITILAQTAKPVPKNYKWEYAVPLEQGERKLIE
jgi:hypothetical protein